MEFWKNIFGVICATMVLYVHSAQGGTAQSCATPTKILEINTIVDELQIVLNDIFNLGGSEMASYDRVFLMACQNETYKGQIDLLAADVMQCLELTFSTNIASLSLGDKTFIDIMGMFPQGGIAEFCSCSPYLAGAMFLNEARTSYGVNVTNGQYATVANLPFYCTQSLTMGPDIYSIRAILKNTLDGLDTECPRVYTLAGMRSTENAQDIKNFLPTCSSFDAAEFQCATAASATDEFKGCMAGAVGDYSACKMYNCVQNHINATCGGNSGISYIRAVNIQHNVAVIAEVADTTCPSSGASSAFHVPLLAVLTSLLLGVFV